MGTAQFAMLPAHFKTMDADITEAIIACFPYVHNHPDVFGDISTVLTRCLAAVVHHADWLRKELQDDPNHPVLKSWLFRHPENLAVLKENVCIGVKGCEHMTATGLTPETNILIKVDEMQAEMAVLVSELRDAFPRNVATEVISFLNEAGYKTGNATPDYIDKTMGTRAVSLLIIRYESNESTGTVIY